MTEERSSVAPKVGDEVASYLLSLSCFSWFYWEMMNVHTQRAGDYTREEDFHNTESITWNKYIAVQ